MKYASVDAVGMSVGKLFQAAGPVTQNVHMSSRRPLVVVVAHVVVVVVVVVVAAAAAAAAAAVVVVAVSYTHLTLPTNREV